MSQPIKTPMDARQSKALHRLEVPVAPGGAMPPVEGCTKQDYAVLIVIAVGVED